MIHPSIDFLYSTRVWESGKLEDYNYNISFCACGRKKVVILTHRSPPHFVGFLPGRCMTFLLNLAEFTSAGCAKTWSSGVLQSRAVRSREAVSSGAGPAETMREECWGILHRRGPAGFWRHKPKADVFDKKNVPTKPFFSRLVIQEFHSL